MQFILGILLITFACHAADKSTITIYQDGYAVVREARTLTLTTGDNQITVSDLAKNILGESFQIGGTGVTLRQFNFLGPREAHYTFEEFLREARGKNVAFRMDSVTVAKGKLLESTESYIFLQMPDGAVRMFFKNVSRDWTFLEPKLQEERKQAEIRCELANDAAGDKRVDVRYEAAGMQWDARYRLLLDDDSTGVLEGWASILNRVGRNFENADVVLVEGNLGRYRNLALNNQLDEGQISNIVASQAGFKVDPDGGLHARGGRDSEMRLTEEGVEIVAQRKSTVQLDVMGKSSRLSGQDMSSSGFEGVVVPERAPAATYTSERHGDLTLYSLPYPATLKDSAQTEVVLLESSKVKAYQIYSFWGLDRNQPANVTLQLVNKEQEGLGLALPAAELLLFRKTKNGLEQFVGSHRLERTQAGDTVRVNLGGDPEIQCASRTIKLEGEKRTRKMEFEHTLKSAKSDTVAVSCTVRFNGELKVEEAPIETKVQRRDEDRKLDDLRFTMILPPNEEVKALFKVEVKLPK